MRAVHGHQPAADPIGGLDVDPRKHMIGTPNSDGPGNRAWQKTMQMLERVQMEEDARRRSN